MNIDELSMLDEEYLSGFSRLDCQVLEANCKILSEKLERQPNLFRDFLNSDMKALKANLTDGFDEDDDFLDLYSNESNKLKNLFRLSDTEIVEIMPIMEGIAFSYAGTCQTQFLRPMIKQIHSKFIQLNDELAAVTEFLEDDLGGTGLMIKMLAADPSPSEEYVQALQTLIASKEKLQSFPEFITESPLAKITEFNKAARSTNWGLQLWTETLYTLWVGILGRTVANSNDGVNGRKHLLDFLYFCMQPLHEAVEYVTLDNSLRKVQNDVTRRGGLSTPDFKVGGSSPYGALWSKSESSTES